MTHRTLVYTLGGYIIWCWPGNIWTNHATVLVSWENPQAGGTAMCHWLLVLCQRGRYIPCSTRDVTRPICPTVHVGDPSQRSNYPWDVPVLKHWRGNVRQSCLTNQHKKPAGVWHVWTSHHTNLHHHHLVNHIPLTHTAGMWLPAIAVAAHN